MAAPLFAELPTFPGPFLPPNCCFMLRGFYLHFSWNLCRIPFGVRQINIGSIVQTDSANLGGSENKPSVSFSPNKIYVQISVMRCLLWKEPNKYLPVSISISEFLWYLDWSKVQYLESNVCICIQSEIEINQIYLGGDSDV